MALPLAEGERGGEPLIIHAEGNNIKTEKKEKKRKRGCAGVGAHKEPSTSQRRGRAAAKPVGGMAGGTGESATERGCGPGKRAIAGDSA